MDVCNTYVADKVFEIFKVLEFPPSVVGLSNSLSLKVELNLFISAYFKTMCQGSLMTFKEAREISASHRAYDVNVVDEHTIEIIFMPTSECIAKAKYDKIFDNRFVCDLRLMQVDGLPCCNNELHAEIGRYYISGQFEYLNIKHEPEILDFGSIPFKKKTIKSLIIQNNSHLVSLNMQFVKIVGIEVTPKLFTLTPDSSKELLITVKPSSTTVTNIIQFIVKNYHNGFKNFKKFKNDETTLSYTISCKLNIIYPQKKQLPVESLHKLKEQRSEYTYVQNELTIFNMRKKKALELLVTSKPKYVTKPTKENINVGKEKCYSLSLSKSNSQNEETFTIYHLLHVCIFPFVIDFGRVGNSTYGEKEITIKNSSAFTVIIYFLRDQYIYYSANKEITYQVEIKPSAETKMMLYCTSSIVGNYEGTFEYRINDKYYRKHRYIFQTGFPTLIIQEKNLKFGMVTPETFISSVPIKIYNYFNVPIDYKWSISHTDIPFVINPSIGSIPKKACRICDIKYKCTPTKTKSFEIDLINEMTLIPIELCLVTRKLSIKFLQSSVTFKDIALNLETTKKVNLENSSREVATFHIVEPLIPGLSILPMNGVIGPKMVIPFDISLKLSCVIEFTVDICLKINNKENISLTVSGCVVEPKIIIHPKNINIPRIPCGMTTYVPISLQNISSVKTEIEVLDSEDENIFNMYINEGNEKHRVFKFDIEEGHVKTIFIKIYDTCRREYDMYLPFKINGLLGPPNSNPKSTELRYYIEEYERLYANNAKIKIKPTQKDISFCRITGVITMPWLKFSVDNFKIIYSPDSENVIDFFITNVSKCYLHLTIITSKLSPNFSLISVTEDEQSMTNDNQIKFSLNPLESRNFLLKFNPDESDKYVSTALLFVNTNMTTPFYDLTFIGEKRTHIITPSTYRIIFPPAKVGEIVCKQISLSINFKCNLETLSYELKDEFNVCVQFDEFCSGDGQTNSNDTIITANIIVCSTTSIVSSSIITFKHISGSSCDVEVKFCFTYCSLTLHTNFIDCEKNPYPYFPLESQADLYSYLETCLKFLERWMFYQGFRRDLYPKIPDTFHAISSEMSSQVQANQKGISISYLNFIKRLAGPLFKHIHKVISNDVDDTLKYVNEIHATYQEILYLLKARGANIWALEAKFLLSYEQFVIYSTNVSPKSQADVIFTNELLNDMNLFYRLNKQSWIDFILQSYKVFVLDSCFFDCICVSSLPRDIIKVLLNWYNEELQTCHNQLHYNKTLKIIKNITTDLSDGIAIISAILNYCPFLCDIFSSCSEESECTEKSGIINNACLIIDALNQLKLNFPLTSDDFITPNFLQMLFLSIHLYIVLPSFKPKNKINFSPPLLRSSTRKITVNPVSQETLIFSYIVLNNNTNNFTVEKAQSPDNGKKFVLNVTFTAYVVDEFNSTLIVLGYNKTRIFDCYTVLLLNGSVSNLYPFKKYKVTGPIYRQQKVDILVSSPFTAAAKYDIYLLDDEPSIPLKVEKGLISRFLIRRLNLIDKNIFLSGVLAENGQEVQEHKLSLQMICIDTQINNTWIWFKSNVGEFYVKVTSQPRYDLVIDTLQAKLDTWPMMPCSCGENCECYRTTVVMVPHRNESLLKSLRCALAENESEIILQIYDQLIESETGRQILNMLLAEAGTNMSSVQHVLSKDVTYKIKGRGLLPRLDRTILAHHTEEFLALPVTLSLEKTDKYILTFTSDCGMDVRTYKVVFTDSE